VKLSGLPGVQIKDVAAALDVQTTAELRRLKELERRYKVLKEEHELLKKAIRFASGRKRKSSNSSK